MTSGPRSRGPLRAEASGLYRVGLASLAVGLVGVVGLASGCRQQFVIGVVDSAGSGEGSSSVGGTTVEADGSTSSVASGSAGTIASSSSETAVVECEAPPGHSVCDSDGDPFHALGLDCPSGGPFDTQPLVSSALTSPETNAWRVVREYGNVAWESTEGGNLLVLTTGVLPAPDGSGFLEVPQGVTDAAEGNNGNPDGVSLPAPISPLPGSMGGAGGSPFSDCDGVGDCSESLPGPWEAGGPARDLVWMSFDIDVPAGTYGYQVDLAWFSTELPARYQTAGTDIVVWWQSSEAFTGNVATLDGAPLTADALASWVASQGLLGNVAPMIGTGFDGTTGVPCDLPGASYPDCPRGASTGWLTLSGPAEPGERMTIVVAVFDLLDDDRDTTILLDRWCWNCDGCELGVDCGLESMPEGNRKTACIDEE
ncbi:MAG: hypothetical protein AAGF11_47710 [Myxococcota bacterium]